MTQAAVPSINQLADIFINYRRDDTSGHAGRLRHDLLKRFPNRIFLDIHSIGVGSNFTEAIREEVTRCGALIMIIGNQWLSITDAKGKRRLDDPEDFVANEIAQALRLRIKVIPVLVEDAKMPSRENLPAVLHDLVFRNAMELTEKHWTYDVDELIGELEKICGISPPVEVAAPAAPSETVDRNPRRPAWRTKAIVGGPAP